MTEFYDPSCFNVTNLEQAKAAILTDEDVATAYRWEHETPYLGELIGKHLKLLPSHRVLDYGCGVGRIAKELIRRYACSVVGVDLTPGMRALAAAYVENARFGVVPPGRYLDEVVTTCDHAVAVWTFQHILEVEKAIADVRRKLSRSGHLFVVEATNRCLPSTGRTWIADNKNVRDILDSQFKEVTSGTLDPEHTSPRTAKHAFWAMYQHRE